MFVDVVVSFIVLITSDVYVCIASDILLCGRGGFVLRLLSVKVLMHCVSFVFNNL